MLNTYDAMPMLAVKDLAIARRFYEKTLGFEVVKTEEEGELVEFKTGKTGFSIYRSNYAGTNKATAMAWDCGKQLTAVVTDLRKRDVSFLHYDDLPGLKRDGDFHVAGDEKLCWFRDPDGNILGLVGS
jgi:catechol 2,3-dioxygenase-like lactoylglutathione lyase family enzyme